MQRTVLQPRPMKDAKIVASCWKQILAWPIETLMTYHDPPTCAVTTGAHAALESAVHQGVTCVVAGNCGGASAPVMGLAAEELDRDIKRYDLERTWTSFGEYADTVDRSGSSINFCSLVGHGTLRMCVMGADDRPPTNGELAELARPEPQSLRELRSERGMHSVHDQCRDVAPVQTVVTVLALREHRHQALILQPRQMIARR